MTRAKPKKLRIEAQENNLQDLVEYLLENVKTMHGMVTTGEDINLLKYGVHAAEGLIKSIREIVEGDAS